AFPPGHPHVPRYGVVLETLATTKWLSSAATVTTARIVKGMLWVDTHVESTKSYALENKSDKDKAIVIEHPVRAGWTLVATPKPLETTPAVYRFKGDAPAHKVATLTVKE